MDRHTEPPQERTHGDEPSGHGHPHNHGHGHRRGQRGRCCDGEGGRQGRGLRHAARHGTLEDLERYREHLEGELAWAQAEITRRRGEKATETSQY